MRNDELKKVKSEHRRAVDENERLQTEVLKPENNDQVWSA